MKTYKRVSTIKKYLASHRRKKQTIGFIPTMGALHEGHVSLAKASIEENDITVVSVFVNPTQFNQTEDLKKYPRNLEKDAAILKEAGVDYLFAPSVNQVYPLSKKTGPKLDIDHLTFSMEGPNRPGHFEGVVQVVHRLVKITNPDLIYMGQKDFQQFTIIQYMLTHLKMRTRLRVCPIIREENGLAMSSRNQRLSKKIKTEASIIYNNLVAAKKALKSKKPDAIERKAMKDLKTGVFDPEYFEIVDGYTFKKITNPNRHKLIVACTAVWAKKVRLIDNMILKGEHLLYPKKKK
ncbi:MAG: pantoate--beta-alanine ligase [Saprospiraceae bacterium]|nr:pantoate--beta-alanine ligase [Saprospiraceae bacterium]